ncbi:MAG: LPS export ABC transporter periplasmic protein LptC [Kiloniellaceae bacterium]
MRQAIDYTKDKGAARADAPARRPRQPPRLSGRNRYSIFVGLMKVLLPAMAAALILLVVAWPQFTLERDRFRLGIAKLGPGQPENLSMLNARYDGIDGKNRPYTITADMATQSNRNENLIDLELPKADMTLEDGTWLALTARAGQYDSEAKLLDLIGSVSLFHDKGFEIRTESARVDLIEGTAEGAQPVEGHGSAGSINAEGFRVLDRGARIVFTGKSHLTILPGAQEAMR